MPATSTTSDAIEKAWSAVAMEATNGDGYYSVRVFAESACSIFVGQHQPSGLIVFSFEVDPESIKKLTLRQEAKGFQIAIQKPSNAPNQKVRRITISLNRASFRDLFKALAIDVISHCILASTEVDAVIRLESRLEHWRRFLEKSGADGLSTSFQIGLFGELLFLRTMVERGADSAHVLKSWHGPHRENQDYCFGPTAVEVKASASNNPNLVSISNTRQLDGTGLAHLFLYQACFDRRDGSGETLPSAVESLLSHFREDGSNCEDLFESLLIAQGYHHSQSHLYDVAGYTLRTQQLYEVSPGFPRITECDLASGVVEATYKIDLSTAAPFKRNLHQFIDSDLIQ
ncbi:PD-(D/E)XK motif protein [Akkermansiaceae bacterium]|nr:PD-(D/E)XK motif protein [Akkermansiaceae bacterium]